MQPARRRVHTVLRPAQNPGQPGNPKALEKGQRIKDAARELFGKKGFEKTLMRDVAKLAGVPEGTLFLYARDKRNLLLTILNEDLDQVSARSERRVDPNADIIDQVLEFFRPRLVYWSRNPQLSGYALQELMLPEHEGREDDPARYSAVRLAHHTATIRRFVAEKQRRGEIRRGVDPERIASLILMIYLSAMRLWLISPRPRVQAGLAELRQLLELALSGLRSPSKPPAP